MSVQVSFHNVGRIQVSADGSALSSGMVAMCWWQELKMFSHEGKFLGRITLHLTESDVALPIGEQPPYWGIDPQHPQALAVIDDDSPF